MVPEEMVQQRGRWEGDAEMTRPWGTQYVGWRGHMDGEEAHETARETDQGRHEEKQEGGHTEPRGRGWSLAPSANSPSCTLCVSGKTLPSGPLGGSCSGPQIRAEFPQQHSLPP